MIRTNFALTAAYCLVSSVGCTAKDSASAGRTGEIWPADATRLVAENLGGGLLFADRSPPGSTCEAQRERFALDLPTRTLSWERCAWTDTGGPYHPRKGTVTVTDAELAAIDRAMRAVKLTERDDCGNDKPLLQITVTSPAGAKTYADGFNVGCLRGEHIFVDEIDGVFAALAEAAE
jgi:hypothetical protein